VLGEAPPRPPPQPSWLENQLAVGIIALQVRGTNAIAHRAPHGLRGRGTHEDSEVGVARVQRVEEKALESRRNRPKPLTFVNLK